MKTLLRSTPVFRRTFLLLVFALIPFGALHGAPETTESAKPTVSEVSRELICDCPDCGKQALDQCAKCTKGQKYRAVVAEQLKEGKSKAQIINYFADTYGEHMLGNPRAQGFNRSALLLPALALVFGVVPLGWALARRRRNAGALPAMNTTAKSSSDQTAADDPRVAAALRDMDY